MLMSAARYVIGLLPKQVQDSVRVQYRANRERKIRETWLAIGAPSVPAPDINHLLHHLRGAALSKLPRGAAHFVSVGCSGTWYFRWVEEMYGKIPRHTGVEFYSPMPADLPANVHWIANTAGHMPEISDETADIVFSGQNIEHLWSDDVAGFLLESHRILKQGALLVVDSPNRYITARLGWSHPEHTIEFTPDEMCELLDLAGFDVTGKRGIWLCSDPKTGRLLSFDDFWSDGPAALARRITLAEQNLDSSFIWWLEARKSVRRPQTNKLRQRIGDIFAAAWPERVNRLKTLIGKEVLKEGGVWLDSQSRDGMLMFGPYMPLPAGDYSVRFSLLFPEPLSAAGRDAATCEVVSGNDGAVLASIGIRASKSDSGTVREVKLDFSLDRTVFGMQFRVIAKQGIHMLARKAVRLECVAERAESDGCLVRQ
jgi:SAM-dependent methyltransferase